MSSRAVYSIRIFGDASLVSSAGVVGPIVPDGLVYVLRDVDAVNISATVPASMEIRSQAEGVLWFPQRNASTDPINWQWRGRQVYNTGEQVGFVVLNGTWSIAASGYQLTLP